APYLDNAAKSVKDIDVSLIPEAQQPTVALLVSEVPELVAAMHDLRQHADALYEILGGPEQRRYLVVFQNSAELRPTGGFIGSYAEMTMDQGAVRNIEVPGG